MRTGIGGVLVAAAFMSLSPPGWTESACDLQAARQAYEIGRLRDVEALVTPCLAEDVAPSVRSAAYELLAKSLLELDQPERAAEAVRGLFKVDLEYRAADDDPRAFVTLVEELRPKKGTQVTSVSKAGESLREAPATVVVVTAEEIRRRGYVDLEQVIHDLPGFDISRSNGIEYSTLHQRGYRSDLTQRTLLLIDDVEENDLWCQAAWLSRQYPLSNVDHIEVIYGPASTIYGPNAFAGVIKVVTRRPEQVVAAGKSIGVRADTGTGSWGTSWADATVAGKTDSGDVSWSLTLRGYRSDEWDLSKYPEWDYDLAAYDWRYDFLRRTSYQSRLSITSGAQSFLNAHPGMPLDSPFYTIQRDPVTGSATAILLTEAGAQRAVELDLAGYATLNGEPVRFSDPTDDWAVSGKLNLKNLTIGMQVWQREEGWTSSHQDMYAPGAENGFTWSPRQLSLFASYSQHLRDDLELTWFTGFKRGDLAEPTVGHTFYGYSSTAPTSLMTGAYGFNIADLATGKQSFWLPTYFYQQSSQLRTELSFVYTPSQKLDLVTGTEVRLGDIQGTYEWGPNPHPSETGSPRWSIPGGNRFLTTDAGLYAQASYRPWPAWKLVLGGRLDNNQVRTTGGYGTVFNPRVGVVYSPGDLTFKLIYAEGVQEVSNFTKYVYPNVQNVEALTPEKVKNTELSAAWQPTTRLSLGLTAYEATYSDVPQLFGLNTGVLTFQQIGALEVRGAELNASYEVGIFTLFGNYTYLHPCNTNPVDARGNPIGRELRVTDIAEHHVNLGVNAELWDRLSIDLRGNYVSKRDQGRDTTALLFGGTFNYPMVDSYVVAHAALTYDTPWAGASVQLVVNNLLDEEYFDPGPRDKDPIYTGRSPQPGRSFFVRLIYQH